MAPGQSDLLERLPQEKSSEGREESPAASDQKQVSAPLSGGKWTRGSSIDCKDGRVKAQQFQADWPVLAGTGDCKDGRVKNLFAPTSSTLALIAKMDLIGTGGKIW
jgi:hypothetical protein